jgi:hypothetical protein
LSTGLADSGAFGDNGGDPRRRPFEGKGAISRWRVELPQLRQFDYRTIDDLIVEIRYTAREGGSGYAEATVVPGLLERLDARVLALGKGWARSWSARQSFAAAWTGFAKGAGTPLVLELTEAHYPFAPDGRRRRLRRVHLLVEGLGVADPTVGIEMLGIGGPGAGPAPEPVVAELSLLSSSNFPGTYAGGAEIEASAVGTLTVTDLDSSASDVVVLVEYDFVEA